MACLDGISVLEAVVRRVVGMAIPEGMRGREM